MTTPIFHIDHPSTEEAQDVMDLVALCDIEAIGEPDISLSDVLDLWQAVDIETDVFVARSDDTKLVGYAFVEQTGANRLDSCVFVHPEFKGLGIGSSLLAQVEQRALQITKDLPGPQRLMNQLPFTNLAARELVESAGYTFSRLYERMKIELDALPELFELPSRFTIQPFRPGMDAHTLFETYNETFKDSWGYAEKEEATWLAQKTGEGFDPSLWFLVWDGTTAAGFLMGRLEEDGLFIDLLGVKREYRKHGIGKALLLRAFHEAYQRNERTVILYVDSDSLTNANRLYRSVGMTPHSQTAVYEKVVKYASPN
ncbi:GNAT family N-acetyltransferase [Chryseomicrobium excrementi]|nr:GNAT family N-acetyltransferase [Chryseomicrobium excrementi]